jgi:hypothetical protein
MSGDGALAQRTKPKYEGESPSYQRPFQDSAPEKILDAVIMRFKFDTHIRARVTREGDAYTFIMHHDLGPKWSLFWENGARGIVERFFHVEPRTTRGESVVTASFKVNPKNLPT